MDIKTKEYTVVEYCPKSYKRNIAYDDCKKCPFNINDNCVYNETTLDTSLHVTEFETSTAKYHIKKWNDLSDEQKENFLKMTETNDVDEATCYACCFLHKIPGKGDICQLRYSSNETVELNMLCCYDNEYWEKVESYEE
jgi:hypothetical protein